SDGNGTTSLNGYLTVFDDSIGNPVTSSTYLAPWTNYVKPQNPMGIFGGTVLNGNWILSVTDKAAGNIGTILGWGIRLNNATLVGNGKIFTEVPDKFELNQNYPNPFNPETKIIFTVPQQSKVVLKVYDILGKEVSTIVNETLLPGKYEKTFSGLSFASGVYFYKMEAGEFTSVKKMVLLK
ncbi:MAG: T9SS type A sorting domain-containing protein, partial [Ignavibacteria bacterium]